MTESVKKINRSFSIENKLKNVDNSLFDLTPGTAHQRSESFERKSLMYNPKRLSLSSLKSKNQFNLNLFSDYHSIFNESSGRVSKASAINDKANEHSLYNFIKKTSMETNDSSVCYSVSNFIQDEEDTEFANALLAKYKEEQENSEEAEINSFHEQDLEFPKIDCDEDSQENVNNLDTDENKMLLSNLFSLATEQSSCRYLQQKIDAEPRLANEYFYSTILADINELIVNPFGNYLIQKILSYISDVQISEILTLITDNFFTISTNFYGTRVIQKMIECISSEVPMLTLIEIIRNYFSKMLNDINASHIIIKMLSLKKNYITTPIYEMINMGLLDISTHKHGCCAIQKILESDSENTESIINNIINNALTLITHQYGNYTIQYILQMKNSLYTFRLIMVLLPNFTNLCLQKYSSTILEKCFELSDESTRNLLLQMLYNQNIMRTLVCNKYGNYVVQKAIDTSEEKTKIVLLKMIVPMVNEIRRENFGRQLFTKLYSKYRLFQEIMYSSH